MKESLLFEILLGLALKQQQQQQHFFYFTPQYTRNKNL